MVTISTALMMIKKPINKTTKNEYSVIVIIYTHTHIYTSLSTMNRTEYRTIQTITEPLLSGRCETGFIGHSGAFTLTIIYIFIYNIMKQCCFWRYIGPLTKPYIYIRY